MTDPKSQVKLDAQHSGEPEPSSSTLENIPEEILFDVIGCLAKAYAEQMRSILTAQHYMVTSGELRRTSRYLNTKCLDLVCHVAIVERQLETPSPSLSEISYFMTKRSLARLWAVSQNPKLAHLIRTISFESYDFPLHALKKYNPFATGLSCAVSVEPEFDVLSRDPVHHPNQKNLYRACLAAHIEHRKIIYKKKRKIDRDEISMIYVLGSFVNLNCIKFVRASITDLMDYIPVFQDADMRLLSQDKDPVPGLRAKDLYEDINWRTFKRHVRLMPPSLNLNTLAITGSRQSITSLRDYDSFAEPFTDTYDPLEGGIMSLVHHTEYWSQPCKSFALSSKVGRESFPTPRMVQGIFPVSVLIDKQMLPHLPFLEFLYACSDALVNLELINCVVDHSAFAETPQEREALAWKMILVGLRRLTNLQHTKVILKVDKANDPLPILKFDLPVQQIQPTTPSDRSHDPRGDQVYLYYDLSKWVMDKMAPFKLTIEGDDHNTPGYLREIFDWLLYGLKTVYKSYETNQTLTKTTYIS